MKEARRRLLTLSDERLPLLGPMLGDAAGEMLGAAAGLVGAEIVTARPAQVSWRPGKSLSVRYETKVAWNDNRKATAEQFVAVTGIEPPADGAVVVENGGHRAAIWRFPADPWLPGLPTALGESAARRLLDTLDVPQGRPRLQLRAYRPTRRAVVEMRVGATRLFAKVVPPADVERLQRRHKLMSQMLPVPRSHGWSAEHGLVVMEALPGRTLRDCLDDRAAALPDPRDLSALLDRIPDPGDERTSGSLLRQARSHARLLVQLLPETKDRLETLVSAIEAGEDDDAIVPVHGDFYENQLLVAGGAISGLIDIDTVSMGRRSDDWATLLGHLSTLEESNRPVMRQRARAYAAETLALADSQTRNRVTLRLKVASVALGLATGPFRVQTQQWPTETMRRISLAERWLADARSADGDEKNLITASGVSHAQQ